MSVPASRPHTTRRLVAACCTLMLAATLWPGCQQPPARIPSALGPVADRLRAAYADLESGRFLTIADFEHRRHQTLFRAEPPSTKPSISVRRSRLSTGAGSLHFVLPDRHARLICDDQQATGWALPRDWQGHWLLLMSLYAAQPVDHLTFAIESGLDQPQRFELGGLRLQPGWNLVRIDLSEAAQQVDLSDVRRLYWWCPQLNEPLELYLDDLILADNQQDLLAPSDDADDTLYVRRRGRSLHIGSSGRFELVFRQGRLQQWYDLGSDPQRNRPLAAGGGLGPHLLALSAQRVAGQVDASDYADFSALGPVVESRQRLLELHRSRVVVEGNWRYSEPRSQAESSRSGAKPTPPVQQRHVYTITPQGRVYIDLSSSLKPGDPPPADVGFALCVSADAGFEPEFPRSTQPDDAGLSFALLGRRQASQADLLAVIHRAEDAPIHEILRDDRELPVGVMMCGGQPSADPFRWAMMLSFWPDDLDNLTEAALIAADYCVPAQLDVEVGQLVRDEPGDRNNDGFCETGGYYTLAMENALTRFRIDGRRQLRFYPTFKLVGSADTPCWAYADGRLLRRVWRSSEDVAFMLIDKIVDKPMTIEVIAGDQPLQTPAP